MRGTRRLPAVALAGLLACGCALAQPAPQPAGGPGPATEATRAVQQAALATLPAAQVKQLAEDARRGLVEEAGDLVVTGPAGHAIWRLADYGFLRGRDEAPDTVHPALWLQAQLNLASGLFRVTDRVWQVRGLDLSNMTILEGETGVVVIDPLLSVETARAALALYFRHRPQRPVVAVVYTHSHVDHFGGVRGVIDEADVRAGKVQVIAPAGFLEEAVGENVIAGPAMGRRAHYQFGALLPRGERGQVDAGLGKAGPPGTLSLIAPTRLVSQPVERLRIDGIDIVFALTSHSEAPSEMILHLPQWKVLNMADIAAQGMHNLLPLRGAQVRDALAWSHHLNQALQRFGADSDILIAQHNWPVWGRERVRSMLRAQRDLYKYVHDQSVRLMNQGVPADEAAERIQLPASLADEWSVRPFYGHLKHNVRAVYQRYLGYYDGNPARLEALPPVAAARKTIAYMGGADAVLQRAREDYARGEYRWVAQVASQLVYAEPGNRAARALAADAYEQLGYQQESATARNAFLQGAAELRAGVPRLSRGGAPAGDLARALPLGQFFDTLGIRLDAAKAAGHRITVNWRLVDTGEQHVLHLEHSALTHLPGARDPQAQATLTLDRATLDDILLQRTTMPAAVQAGRVRLDGDAGAVAALFGMLDPPAARTFPLVEPLAGAL
jgi:alkyl sulfatase BDS1-like metallo-beta-lactamase superfamily hydrolase